MRPSSYFVASLVLFSSPTMAAYTGNELKRDLDSFVIFDEKMHKEEPPNWKDAHGAGMAFGFISGEASALAGSVICFSNATTQGQIVAVVAKFINAHPEDWDKPANVLILRALYESFPRCSESR
jgi:hypothetical protein